MGEVSHLLQALMALRQAWIMNASLKDNILFGLEYDAGRYQAVLSACALATVQVLIRCLMLSSVSCKEQLFAYRTKCIHGRISDEGDWSLSCLLYFKLKRRWLP